MLSCHLQCDASCMLCAHGGCHGQQDEHAHVPFSCSFHSEIASRHTQSRLNNHEPILIGGPTPSFAQTAVNFCNNARHGMRMSIGKMKAHTGLTGNVLADRLANEARQTADCDAMVLVGNITVQDVFSPCARATATEPQCTMSKLCHAIKPQARHLSGGFASRGMYEYFWRVVMPKLHPKRLASGERAPSPRLP